MQPAQGSTVGVRNGPTAQAQFVPESVVPAVLTQQTEGIVTRELKEAFIAGVTNPAAFLNALLAEVVKLGASDVFFEPQKDVLLVRTRVDGVLYQLGQFDRAHYAAIIARLKILAKLDTTERRRVQEGQYVFESGGKSVNLRIEIVQTIFDELVVIRILQLSSIVMALKDLGFSEGSLKTYQQILQSKSGLLLVCGPTGSGKTTTLYSTIMHLNEKHDYNVMTVEDPVEYQLPFVNQMPVREEVGFTFGEGLRAILRLSPDIILVGEIRDKETALIAVESGLTGHMVMSTIHAPDAVGVVYRLLDLGVESYLFNSALRGIVAQRLVRKVCNQCKTAYAPTPDEVDLFTKTLGRAPKQLVKGVGCEACQNIGYSGRLGIYEVMQVEAGVRGIIRAQKGEDELRESLRKNGYVTLFADGLLKCEAGLTSTEEVLRNSLRVE